jgi:hypothetical protein
MQTVEDSIQAMLTTEPFFQSLFDKPLANAKQANELFICLSCENREAAHRIRPRIMASGTTRASRISMAICGIWCGRCHKPESGPVNGSSRRKLPATAGACQIQFKPISGLAGRSSRNFCNTRHKKAAASYRELRLPHFLITGRLHLVVIGGLEPPTPAL